MKKIGFLLEKILLTVVLGVCGDVVKVEAIVDPKVAEENFKKSDDKAQSEKIPSMKEESINKQIEPSKDSLLHWAARYKKSQTVKALLARGANPQAINEKGFTPLHEVAVRGGSDDKYLEIAKDLIGAVDVSEKINYINLKSKGKKGKSALGFSKGNVKEFLEDVIKSQPEVHEKPHVLQKSLGDLQKNLGDLSKKLEELSTQLKELKKKVNP